MHGLVCKFEILLISYTEGEKRWKKRLPAWQPAKLWCIYAIGVFDEALHGDEICFVPEARQCETTVLAGLVRLIPWQQTSVELKPTRWTRNWNRKKINCEIDHLHDDYIFAINSKNYSNHWLFFRFCALFQTFVS